MRIVDISEFFSDHGGGVRIYVHQKLEAYAKAGIEAAIIAPGAEDRREARSGGEIIWVRSPTLAFDHRYHLFGRAQPVFDLLDELKPHILEASSTWRGGWIAARWRGDAKKPALKSLFLHQDPVAVYPHSLFSPFIDESRLDRVFSWFWEYLRRLSDHFQSIVVGSNWFASRLKQNGVGDPTVIPLGVEKNLFLPEKRSEQTRRMMLNTCGIDDPTATLFMAVSRHHPEKRLPVLIDAFRQFSAKEKAGLYLVGDGPSWRTIKQRARSCGGVKVAGVIKDRIELATQMASADYFIHGGAAETFGLVVAEALSAGIPFLAPHLGGASDFANDAYSETYRAGDSSSCFAAMQRITARNRTSMAKAASDASQIISSPQIHFDRLINHFETILDNRGQRLAA
ncbi:MAG: glycosyltransferase [Pseudomonadota bacterium]